MTITVYFAEEENLHIDEPKPVYKDFSTAQKKASEENSSDFLNDIHLCPAVKQYYVNTFAVTSPFSWDLFWDKNSEWFFSKTLNQEQFNTNFLVRNAKSGFLSARLPRLLIIPDKSVEIEFLPSSLTNAKFNKNISFISGTFNPHKHIRPIELPMLIIDPNEGIFCRPNSHLYYLKFLTTEKIKFKRFLCTKSVKELVSKNLDNRNIDNNILSLNWWYDMNARIGLRDKIMKEVMKNLC